jgi:hypothetical protein
VKIHPIVTAVNRHALTTGGTKLEQRRCERCQRLLQAWCRNDQIRTACHECARLILTPRNSNDWIVADLDSEGPTA